MTLSILNKVVAVDICLINMPYAEIKFPSIALGLLQAALHENRFQVRSIHANMEFAEAIGLLGYHRLSLFPARHAVSDWTFAHIAFPDFNPDHEAYVDLVRQRNRIYREVSRSRFVEMLLRVRTAADRLVERVVDRVLQLSPAIVGCSSTFCQHVSSLAVLRKIREADPRVVTMLGGANCESIMGFTTHRSFPWVDFVISGEADSLIAPLCRQIVHKGCEIGPEDLPTGVLGPIHRVRGYPNQGNGSTEPPRAESPSLESLPLPNYDDFVSTLNASPILSNAISPGLTVETSRGCWWGERKRCTFCGLNGNERRFRSKSAEKALGEFEALRRRYNIERFEAVDNILDIGYFKTLLPQLKEKKRPFRLFYETKSNLRKNQVKALRDAGVIWIQPGIESLHSKLLGLMNKGSKARHNIQLLKWCRQYGIFAGWLLLHDVPGEDDRWYREMADLFPRITHLQPPLKLLPILFYRFSRYHEHPEHYGLNLIPSSLFSYVYPLSRSVLADLVYSFEDKDQARISQDPILSELLVPHGLERLKEEFRTWHSAYWKGQRPVLSMKVGDREVQVTDTRPSAVTHSVNVRGTERELLLALDESVECGEFLHGLQSAGHDMNKADEALLNLKERGLILEIDGHFLALPLREPVPDLPQTKDFPGGHIDFSQCKPGPKG